MGKPMFSTTAPPSVSDQAITVSAMAVPRPMLRVTTSAGTSLVTWAFRDSVIACLARCPVGPVLEKNTSTALVKAAFSTTASS